MAEIARFHLWIFLIGWTSFNLKIMFRREIIKYSRVWEGRRNCFAWPILPRKIMPRLFSGGRDLEGVLGILECVNRVLWYLSGIVRELGGFIRPIAWWIQCLKVQNRPFMSALTTREWSFSVFIWRGHCSQLKFQIFHNLTMVKLVTLTSMRLEWEVVSIVKHKIWPLFNPQKIHTHTNEEKV